MALIAIGGMRYGFSYPSNLMSGFDKNYRISKIPSIGVYYSPQKLIYLYGSHFSNKKKF